MRVHMKRVSFRNGKCRGTVKRRGKSRRKICYVRVKGSHHMGRKKY